jgi:hypothetical protein
MLTSKITAVKGCGGFETEPNWIAVYLNALLEYYFTRQI